MVTINIYLKNLLRLYKKAAYLRSSKKEKFIMLIKLIMNFHRMII